MRSLCFSCSAAHHQSTLVRVKKQEQDADDDGNYERDEVESSEGDLVDDLVNDLEDAVQDHRSHPADVSFGVEARDHHARAEGHSGHRPGDSEPFVKPKEAGTDVAAGGSSDQENSHEPHQNLQCERIPLRHYSVLLEWTALAGCLVRLGGLSSATCTPNNDDLQDCQDATSAPARHTLRGRRPY